MNTDDRIRIFSFLIALPCSVLFFLLLFTTHYMYAFYALFSLTLYFLTRLLGKELYLFLFFIRILVGSQLTGLFFGISSNDSDLLNPLKVHVFTLCWLVAFCLEFLEMLSTGSLRFDKIVVAALLLLLCFGGVTVLRRGFSGLALWIESYVGPVTLFLFCHLKKDLSFPRMRRYMQVMLALLMATAVFAFIEYGTRANPFTAYFAEAVSGNFVGQSDDAYRTLGMVGHVMLPNLMLLGCMIASTALRRPLPRAGAYLLFFFAAMFSKTRTMLVLIFLYVLVVEGRQVLRRVRMAGRGRRALLLAGAGILAGGLLVAGLVMLTPAGRGVLARFLEDSGSSNARVLQIRYFFSHLFRMPLYGLGGFTDNVLIYNEFNQVSIPEIPWINLYFEMGPFLILLLIFLWLAIRAGNKKWELVLLLVAYTPYTSFSTKTSSFSIFFLLAAYGMLSKRYLARHPEAGEENRVPAPKPFFPAAPSRARLRRNLPITLALCVSAGILGMLLANLSMPKHYRAVVEMYVWPLAQTGTDNTFVTQNMEIALRINTAIAEDLIATVHTPRVLDNALAALEGQGLPAADMPEDWRENLTAETLQNGRVLCLTYTDTSSNRTWQVVNAVGTALEQAARELDGQAYVQLLAPATPLRVENYYSPNPPSIAVLSSLFALMVTVLVQLVAHGLRARTREIRSLSDGPAARPRLYSPLD